MLITINRMIKNKNLFAEQLICGKTLEYVMIDKISSLQTSFNEAFTKKLLVVNYFCKKLHLKC